MPPGTRGVTAKGEERNGEAGRGLPDAHWAANHVVYRTAAAAAWSSRTGRGVGPTATGLGRSHLVHGLVNQDLRRSFASAERPCPQRLPQCSAQGGSLGARTARRVREGLASLVARSPLSEDRGNMGGATGQESDVC